MNQLKEERRHHGHWGQSGGTQHWSHEPSIGGDAKQGGGRDGDEHGLRSMQITLPELVEPGTKLAMLEAGDWIAQLRPLIQHVATRALPWWDRLVRQTMEAYHQWLAAGPLDRLKILPPGVEDTSAGMVRLDQRVTMMLMNAVPESIRHEIVAARQLHASGVLYKVLRTYQPGGLSERALTWSAITQTQPAEDPSQATEALRLWRRQVLRALELQALLPDPTLQVKALDTIVERILAVDQQAQFRVSAFRLQHGIDVKPTVENVGHLHDMLLAEADRMVYDRASEEAKPPKVEPSGKAAMKALQGGAEKASPTTSICKSWGKEGGCRFGKGMQIPASGSSGQVLEVLDLQFVATSKGRLPLQEGRRDIQSGERKGVQGQGQGQEQASLQGQGWQCPAAGWRRLYSGSQGGGTLGEGGARRGVSNPVPGSRGEVRRR